MSSDESSPKRISDIVERLAGLFADQGGDLYGGEAVTQLEHALQAAQLAEQEDCPSHEIVAALLHDVCLLYTSPSPRDGLLSRMPSSA